MTVDNSFAAKLEAARIARSSPGGASSGGGGPHDPSTERRLTAVEANLRDVTESLKRLEIAATRIEAAMATKADVATLTERSVGVATRLAALEDANKTTIASALGKTIGIGGAMTLFVAQFTVLGVAVALLRYFHIL